MSKKIINTENRIKWLIIAIAIVVAVIVTIKIVNATSWKLEVNSNKTEARAGEEIFVEIKISDIDMGNLRYKCLRSNIGI